MAAPESVGTISFKTKTSTPPVVEQVSETKQKIYAKTSAKA